jgi:predicted amidophosphoribosyltransferase
MEFIAHSLFVQTGLRAVSILARHERADQRRLNRRQRKDNMSRVFFTEGHPLAPSGSSVQRLILIDDVFTTGATLDTATRTLLSAGLQEVRVATIARVW